MLGKYVVQICFITYFWAKFGAIRVIFINFAVSKREPNAFSGVN